MDLRSESSSGYEGIKFTISTQLNPTRQIIFVKQKFKGQNTAKSKLKCS